MSRRSTIIGLLLVTASIGCAPGDANNASPARIAAAVDISYPVTPVAQTKTMSCWAAAAAMMLAWKNNVPTTELAAAQAAGPNFVLAFRNNTGITGPEIGELARGLSLKAEAPQNFTAQGYATLLKKGPLWVGTAIFYQDRVYRHVRIVRGIHGDGTEGGSKLDIVDPDGGRSYSSTVAQFAIEMETIARQDLGAGRNLSPQVLHF